MPVTFQKVMDCTLVRLKNTHCCFDDIIIDSRGSQGSHHLKVVYQCSKKKLMRIIYLPKPHFPKTEIEWLVCKFSQSGIARLESKTSAILNLSAPKK